MRKWTQDRTVPYADSNPPAMGRSRWQPFTTGLDTRDRTKTHSSWPPFGVNQAQLPNLLHQILIKKRRRSLPWPFCCCFSAQRHENRRRCLGGFLVCCCLVSWGDADKRIIRDTSTGHTSLAGYGIRRCLPGRRRGTSRLAWLLTIRKEVSSSPGQRPWVKVSGHGVEAERTRHCRYRVASESPTCETADRQQFV
jgi:hypothetical protein